MKKSKVLNIEDTKSIREEHRDILIFEGMQVFTAENRQEGIGKAKGHLPDLILCDIMMPDKTVLRCSPKFKIRTTLSSHFSFS